MTVHKAVRTVLSSKTPEVIHGKGVVIKWSVHLPLPLSLSLFFSISFSLIPSYPWCLVLYHLYFPLTPVRVPHASHTQLCIVNQMFSDTLYTESAVQQAGMRRRLNPWSGSSRKWKYSRKLQVPRVLYVSGSLAEVLVHSHHDWLILCMSLCMKPSFTFCFHQVLCICSTVKYNEASVCFNGRNFLLFAL